MESASWLTTSTAREAIRYLQQARARPADWITSTLAGGLDRLTGGTHSAQRSARSASSIGISAVVRLTCSKFCRTSASTHLLQEATGVTAHHAGADLKSPSVEAAGRRRAEDHQANDRNRPWLANCRPTDGRGFWRATTTSGDIPPRSMPTAGQTGARSLAPAVPLLLRGAAFFPKQRPPARQRVIELGDKTAGRVHLRLLGAEPAQCLGISAANLPLPGREPDRRMTYGT